MASQDDKLYRALLTELVFTKKPELESKICEFDNYVREKLAEEYARVDALKKEYNRQLKELKESYDNIVRATKEELDGHMQEYSAKLEADLQQKKKEALISFEISLKREYNSLVAENNALQRDYEIEWYEVDNLKKDLLKVNIDIERNSKDTENDEENFIALQQHAERIRTKNEEINRLYDRLSQNLLNKITLMEDDIKRMQQLCNHLASDDVSNVKSINENEAPRDHGTRQDEVVSTDTDHNIHPNTIEKVEN